MVPLAYGIITDLHVSDALTRVMRVRNRDFLAIIRGIDSSRSLEELVKILALHRIGHRVVEGNACVSMDSLQDALDAGVFTGFDEVWIVDGSPPAFGLTQLPSATSDAADFSEGVPIELGEAMERAKCVVVLGDGCGLNYATSSERIQREIATA